MKLPVHKDDFSGDGSFLDGDHAVKVSDLQKLPARSRIMTIGRHFLAFMNGLRHSDNEVVRFTVAFMDMATEYEIFCNSIKCGDAYTVELLLVDWIPVWHVSSKHRYFNLSLRMVEVLYGDLTSVQLEEVRRNRFIRMHKGKGSVAMDDFCEILNFLI